MYKFEIYRNPNNPLQSSLYNDSVRYYESLYLFEREISPKWDGLAISNKKDDGRYFFREYLDGDFTLTGSDFDWVNSIRTDNDEKHLYRLLYVKELVDNAWTTIWTGFFTVVDGEYNLSRCSAKFSDLLPFDKYSVIIENIEKEVNLIDVPTVPVYYDRHTYKYDVDVVTSQEYYGITNCVSPIFPTICGVLPSEHFPDELEKWTLVNKRTAYGGQAYNGGIWSWIYNITLEYRRDYVWASSNPDASKWVLIETGDTLNKYARHYKNMDSLSFNENRYSKLILNQETESYCKFWYSNNDVVLPSDLEVENTRARTLSATIYHVLNQFSVVQEYESLFFQGVTNPITGTTNRLNNVVVWQLSDMKPTSDPATIGMYSFKDVEDWLRMFQCGWYIDEYNNLKIEHRKYFDNGLSYNDNSFNEGDGDLNAASDPRTSGLENISLIGDYPQQELMKFAYSNNQDFVGLPITYHGSIINRDEDSSKKEYSFSNLATDLTYVTSNEEEIGNDGFFMAACGLNGLGQLYVYQTNGAISTSLIWNGFLSTANLMSDYWKWGRSIVAGVMNNVLTTFTPKDSVTQSDVKVTKCDTFNPYKLVRTSYGDGSVVESTKTLKEKKLTLTLSYEA